MATTYPATLSNLRERVRYRLLTSSSATDHWPDAKLNFYLNRAQLEVQDELVQVFDSRYFVHTDESVVPNNRVIALPEGWIRVLALDKQSGSEWLPVEIVTPARAIEYRYGLPNLPLNASTQVSQREVWSQIGESLSAQLATPTGVYRLRTVQRVRDLESDDDTTEIPAQYQDLMVDLAAAKCARDGSQPDRAAPLERDYEAGLFRLKRTAGKSVPGMVYKVRRARGRR